MPETGVPKTAREAFIDMRDRIADEKNWTVGTLARNLWGGKVHPNDPQAARWCALGSKIATLKKNPDLELMGEIHAGLESAATSLFGSCSLTSINDNMGHYVVMQVFAYAIEHAPA